MRRRALPVLTAALLLLLTGCGTAGAPASGADGAGEDPPRSPGSVACPSPVHGDLPPECVAYDPDEAMALNEQYRERMPLDEGYAASLAPLVEDVRARLGAVPAGDEAAARAALEDAGLTAVQSRSGAGDVLFGAVPPDGGCVYGAVEPDAVTVEVGGFIMDGGCLPAQ